MPNQTIDLSRDCEAWYDFDTDYFDAQRGQIQDRSGYGRHAQANGGPTVGVEGPDSFEAARFDGSDDYFNTGHTFDQTGSSVTVHAVFNSNDRSKAQAIWDQSGSDSGILLRYRGINNNFISVVKNSSDNSLIRQSQGPENEWASATLRYDGSTHSLFVNGNLIGTDTISVDQKSNDTAHIGSASFAPPRDTFDGEIAFVGRWSRALSDAEREYLNRLTAPRRGQL